MRIAVLTTGRHDWAILRSTCKLLSADPQFKLMLLVGGMHNAARYGNTWKYIPWSGVEITRRLTWTTEYGEYPTYLEASQAMEKVGEALTEVERPDCFLVVGDRYEVASACIAATVLRLPIVHLHGGEVTEGSFDNQFRNAISKMAHLHLVSGEEAKGLLVGMGESPETVHVVGVPGLDNAFRDDLASRETLENKLGMALDPPVTLVALQPTTLGDEEGRNLCELKKRIKEEPGRYVILLPNSDPGHLLLRKRLRSLAMEKGVVAVEALPETEYFGLLKLVDRCLGNSSSFVLEAPSLGKEVILLGDRQKGRLTPSLCDGKACERVVDALRKWSIPRTCRKLPVQPGAPIAHTA